MSVLSFWIRGKITTSLLAIVAFALTAATPDTIKAHDHSVKVQPNTAEIAFLSRSNRHVAGVRRDVEEGLLLVPENRANPNSRKISIYFVRFPHPAPRHAPRIYVPGGPGGHHNVLSLKADGDPVYSNFGAIDSSWGGRLLNLFGQDADVVFLNQRGNIGVPFSPGLTMSISLDGNSEADQAYLQAALDSIQRAGDVGIDYKGYDFIHVIDDVETLRSALNYDKVAVVGGSFGSQTALGYATRYPERTDRLIIDGVEPLDFAYDSPADLDAAIARALARQRFGSVTPETIFKADALLKKLKSDLTSEKPTVILQGKDEVCVGITLTGFDFAAAVAKLRFAKGTLRDRLGQLNRFIKEIEKGDLSHLAAIKHSASGIGVKPLIFPLIDTSLDISEDRDQRLLSEAEGSFVGDVNTLYRHMRGKLPTAEVTDEFRRFRRLQMPVLMLQGDNDFSTPLENAIAQHEWMPNAHLVILEGGTHNVFNEAMDHSEYSQRALKDFLAADMPLGRRTTRLSLPENAKENTKLSLMETYLPSYQRCAEPMGVTALSDTIQ